MKIRTLVLFFLIGLTISSCSIHKTFIESEHILSFNTKAQNICVYREEKGISELVLKEDSQYYFRFYPGDETIAVNSNLVPNFSTLQLGDEIKATKTFLVNGDKFNCAPFELIF